MDVKNEFGTEQTEEEKVLDKINNKYTLINNGSSDMNRICKTNKKHITIEKTFEKIRTLPNKFASTPVMNYIIRQPDKISEKISK